MAGGPRQAGDRRQSPQKRCVNLLGLPPRPSCSERAGVQQTRTGNPRPPRETRSSEPTGFKAAPPECTLKSFASLWDKRIFLCSSETPEVSLAAVYNPPHSRGRGGSLPGCKAEKSRAGPSLSPPPRHKGRTKARRAPKPQGPALVLLDRWRISTRKNRKE